MHWSEIALIILAIIGIVIWLLWRTANQIDKLHRKVVASRIALAGQLTRRAGATIELAASQLVDPTSSILLTQSGYQIIDELETPIDPSTAMQMSGLGMERERDESELSAQLRQVFPDQEAIDLVTENPIGHQIMSNLAASWYRATLARRFHNQAVADARNSRRHWWVRVFHLAGHAPLPETSELDDAMPSELFALATARPAPRR
jgi:hypothetical protein